MPEKAARVVTFLFTNIDDRPGPRESDSQEARLALVQHDRLLTETILEERGRIFRDARDDFRAVFDDPTNAVRAALKAQMALQTLARSGGPYLVGACVRMALHSGSPEGYDNRYSGPAITMLTALSRAGHAGQILMSDAMKQVVNKNLPYEASVRDLGIHGMTDSQPPVRIWQLCHPDIAMRFPALEALNLFATNIPPQATAFVGRKGEVTQIRALIKAGRVLTLIGEPGIGKSRLAEQTGIAELQTHPDGVWQISLGPMADAAQLMETIAHALGCREEPRRPLQESLTRFIGNKKLLLILDGFDRAKTPCANLVSHLRAHCPRLSVMATGSTGLGIDDEQTFQVSPMGLPPLPDQAEPTAPPYTMVRYEAARLFIERARDHDPDFLQTPAAAAALCRLCHELDGLPLAIEIAAAHAGALSTEQMAAHIANYQGLLSSSKRSDQLSSDPLSVVLDWTYALLELKEKILLLRLSVFCGGWELTEAEAICADTHSDVASSPSSRIAAAEIAQILERLVDRALVSNREAAGFRRFMLSQPVLEYVRERRWQTRDDAWIRARHSAYFYRMAREGMENIDGPVRTDAMYRLDRSIHNLSAALNEALDQATLPALTASAGAVERLLSFTEAAGNYWIRKGILFEARTRLAIALALPGARKAGISRAGALLAAAGIAKHQGELKKASAFIQEAAAIYRSKTDASGTARCLHMLGEIARELGDHRKARMLYDEAISLYQNTDRRGDEAEGLEAACGVAWLQRDPLAAARCAGEAISLRRELMHDRTVGDALMVIGIAAIERMELTVACNCFGECLSIWRKLGDNVRAASTLENLAKLACLEKRTEWAVSLYATACRLRLESDSVLSALKQAERRDVEAWLQAQIDPDTLNRVFNEECALGLDTIIAQTYSPNLRIVEGGKPAATGVPTIRQANRKP